MGHMRRSRPLTILYSVLAALLVLLVALVVFVLTFDWNRARPYINDKVSQTIGREFAIRGDLDVRLRRGDPAEPGWRRYVPRPEISAGDVYIANPAWTSTGPRLASVGHIVVALHALPLLHQQVVITNLELDKLQVAAQRRADGANTWTFKDNGPSKWEVDIRRLAFREGSLRYLDDGIKLDLRARRPPSTPATAARITACASNWAGRIAARPVTGGGKTGAVLSLRDEHEHLPGPGRRHAGQEQDRRRGHADRPARAGRAST